MLHIPTHCLAEQIVESIAEDTPELIENLEAGRTSSFRVETDIQGKPVIVRILLAEPEWDRTSGGEETEEPEENQSGADDLISEAQSIAKHACKNCKDKQDCCNCEIDAEDEEKTEPYLAAGYDVETKEYELIIDCKVRATREELKKKFPALPIEDTGTIIRLLFEKIWNDNKHFFNNIPEFGDD